MFPSWFRRKRSSRDFEAEIEAHLQLEADALAEQGLGGEQARSAAHRAFGNTASAQERFWEATHWVGPDAFWRDVRYATRCLRKTPSFTLTAIITLAVAIAANAVVFGALNAVILRPLNVPQAKTLYALQPRLHDTSLRLSYPAAGTALLAGRRLDWSDDATAAKVALVNQQFARQLFGSTTAAVGSYFKLHDGTRIEVAGVVENGKYNSLTEAQQPAMFLPLLQWPSSSSVMIVRSPLNPQTLVLAIKGKLRSLDPGLPSFIETWNQAMTGALFAARVAASALGLLGLMGVILSLTGIFGLAAAAVGKRRRELGIRMALGTLPWQVLRTALGPVLRLLAIGSSAGLVLGILAARVLGAVVYKATPRDPLAMAGVVAAMALIGLIAVWVPARRALAIRPAVLLRED